MTDFPGKQLFIFDFDGTIADTSSLHAQAFAEVLAPFNISVDYNAISGLRTSDAILRLFDISFSCRPSQVLLKRLTENKQTCVRQLISLHLKPLPGASEFLHWSSTNFHTCLVTSGSRATVSLALSKLNLTFLFHHMIFSEDVVSSKPSPEGFISALKHFNVHPSQALIFEDSEAGFQAARQASIDYIDVRQSSFQQLLLI